MLKASVALALSVCLLIPITAGAAPSTSGPNVVERGDDLVVRRGDLATALVPQATDPLGLLVGLDTLRDHSLGQDIFEVWSCGVSESAASLAAELTAEVGPWFAYHSRGSYQPVFVGRGNAGSDAGACETHSFANASPNANAALHVMPFAGGFAGPGFTCGFSPCPGSHSYAGGNGRAGFIGNVKGFYATAAHEMGHMLTWPHSNTGAGDQYDNALDLMSGNYGTFGNSYGSYPDPYSTAAINFYAAGWIDPSEVYLYSGDGAHLNLATQGGTGFKMAAIKAGDVYYTLAARIPSPYDPVPAHWSGVEVYRVETCKLDEMSCLFSADPDWLPGFRQLTQWPAVPFDWTELDNYNEPLPQVIRPGESRTVGGVQVVVGAVTGQAMAVAIGASSQVLPDPPPPPPPSTPPPPPPGSESSFVDTAGSVFAADIDWLAESGITKGCNPPTNNLFCPDDVVTRGQMAAFLHRAVPGLTVGAATDFSDDDGLIFESDIEWLSATGVTKGCNPPANDLFCPDDVVTRGQMAAFLHRALPGLAVGPPTDFGDDDGLVFESDIEWLAATGVTKGCNPPANTQFCPGAPVTRGAMAAFLHRALGD